MKVRTRLRLSMARLLDMIDICEGETDAVSSDIVERTRDGDYVISDEALQFLLHGALKAKAMMKSLDKMAHHHGRNAWVRAAGKIQKGTY